MRHRARCTLSNCARRVSAARRRRERHDMIRNRSCDQQPRQIACWKYQPEQTEPLSCRKVVAGVSEQARLIDSKNQRLLSAQRENGGARRKLRCPCRNRRRGCVEEDTLVATRHRSTPWVAVATWAETACSLRQGGRGTPGKVVGLVSKCSPCSSRDSLLRSHKKNFRSFCR